MRRELDAKRVLLSEGLKHLNAPHVAKRTMFGSVMAPVHSFLHHSLSVPFFFGHRNTWTQFTSRSPIFLPGFIVALEMIHRDLAGLSGASCLWQIFFPFF